MYGVAVRDITVAKRHALRSILGSAGGDARVVAADASGGIPAAWNEVLDAAAEEPALEAVVLLHDDTELSEPHLEAKIRAVLGDGTGGVADGAPALLAAAGSRGGDTERWWDASDSVGTLGTPAGHWVGRVGAGDVDRTDDSFLVLAPGPVRTGKRFPLDAGGVPLGATQSTAELCARLRAAGRRITVVPVTHQHHQGPGHDCAGWVPGAGLPAAASAGKRAEDRGPLCLLAPDAEAHVHAHAFDEVESALRGGLARLGFDVRVERDAAGAVRPGEPMIVLAPHLHALDALRRFPTETVFYNWEPLGETGNGITGRDLIAFLATRTVWDYSRRNIDFWRTHGARAKHLAVGYDPSLEVLVPRAAARDIDVLFYGSISPRRREVLREIQRRGVGLYFAFGAYGAERDALIRRSRLVLNMHSYEHATLEVARLGHLWANQVPVISEIGSTTEDSLGMGATMLHAPAVDLADLVQSALDDPSALEVSTVASRERFLRETDAARQLAAVL